MSPASQHGLSTAHYEMLIEVFRAHAPPIERVDLFGSRATGTAKPWSDIDLVIVGAGVNSALIDRLHTELNDLALPMSVDVIADDDLMPPALRAHIEAVRTPLFLHG